MKKYKTLLEAVHADGVEFLGHNELYDAYNITTFEGAEQFVADIEERTPAGQK